MHVEKESRRDVRRDHRRAAVGHERQRDPGDRRHTDRHTDVDEHLERQHRDYTRRKKRSEHVLGEHRDPQASP